jgi:hypothetical protein
VIRRHTDGGWRVGGGEAWWNGVWMEASFRERFN